MNNFPEYQHFGIEIIFNKAKIVDEILVNIIAKALIGELKLNVVSEGKHEFTNHGLTKFWILSQSHMVIHTWPEFEAIQIDLMTCSGGLKKKKIEGLFLEHFDRLALGSGFKIENFNIIGDDD